MPEMIIYVDRHVQLISCENNLIYIYIFVCVCVCVEDRGIKSLSID